jgi:thioredoxin reductase (NADPH)
VVIAYGSREGGEAVFIARTYSDDVTLLTLGQPLELNREQQAKLDQHRIKVVEDPVGALEIEDDRIAAIHFGGREHRSDVLYSALGQHMSAQLNP